MSIDVGYVVRISVLWSLIISTSLSAEQVQRIVNLEGWAIPAQQWIENASDEGAREEIVFRDHKITVERLPRPNQVSTKSVSGRVSLIYLDAESVRLRQIDVVATQVVRYSFGDSVFCYYLTVAPYSPPANGRPGGVSAITIAVAYYDDDNDGVFETLEFPDSILKPGDSKTRIRLSKWIEKNDRK